MKILTKEEVMKIAATSEAANNLMREYYPEFFEVVPTPVPVENAVNLSGLTVRNGQLFIANAKYLGALNRSPMYVFTDKGILVDSAFKPSIEIVNGRHLIVFENKV
jgi:hypothetical protein